MIDSRQSPRLKLPAMYTLVRLRRRGESKFHWMGHIYDISASGMRLELDSALEPGSEVELRAMLPGHASATINAQGHVVRWHDEPDDQGPMRMGVVFDKIRPTDRRLLSDYLQAAGLQAA